MRAIVLAFLVLGFAAPSYAGFPLLSGTWEGSISCKTQDADGKGGFKVDVTLLVYQATLDGPLVVNASGGSIPYFSGTVIPTATGQGSGALISCGTSAATTPGADNVLETFDYKLDRSGEGGTLKITGGAQVTNGSELALCKGTFRRTSAITPKVVACEDL